MNESDDLKQAGEKRSQSPVFREEPHRESNPITMAQLVQSIVCVVLRADAHGYYRYAA